MPEADKTVWYIETRDEAGVPLTMGSGVAVRLRKLGKPKTSRTYLLTCAHVLRGKSQDGAYGFGALHGNVWAWAPGTGFNDNQRVAASVARDMCICDLGDVPPEERDNAARDWIVLELGRSQARDTVETVEQWTDTSEEGSVFGYPGGRASFGDTGVVKPTQSPQPFRLKSDEGILELIGDETRPGMSGGGVFDTETGDFVGIHRARNDATLQLKANSARLIQEKLHELGYEPVSQPRLRR